MATSTREEPTQIDGETDLCCALIGESLLEETDAEQLAIVLKALADPIRLRLVSLIASAEDGEACACDFAEPLGRSQPTISHHLSQLVKAGILQREQRGKWAWFRVDDRRMGDLRRALGADC